MLLQKDEEKKHLQTVLDELGDEETKYYNKTEEITKKIEEQQIDSNRYKQSIECIKQAFEN